MLYRSTHRRCRGGAPVQNLAHSASFHSKENNAPSKPGIKHLGLLDSATQAGADGWLFFYQSVEFLETHQTAARLAGNGPIFVQQQDIVGWWIDGIDHQLRHDGFCGGSSHVVHFRDGKQNGKFSQNAN